MIVELRKNIIINQLILGKLFLVDVYEIRKVQKEWNKCHIKTEEVKPDFIKYGYVWFFNGIAKNERTNLMSQVWNLIKVNYE